MTNRKIEESLLIAEELAKEICTGEPSASSLVRNWKKENPGLNGEIRKLENLPQEIRFHDSIDTEKELEAVNRRIAPPAGKSGRRILYRISIAASLLLVLGTASIRLWMENKKESAVEWAASVPVAPRTSIIAQSDKPVELAENNLAVKGNRLTGNTPDGKKNVAIDLNPDNRFNKLSVPAGGGYRLTLEDGTTIQLNAASELLFPTHFKKHIRQVKLKGEACFKVKSNPESPFYVLLGMLNVEVTGTTFNIKAYETGETTRITLLEGRVNVRKGQEILATLSPGEQFVYRKASHTYGITLADLPATTGWTEEKFVFRNETISNIMDELSRWYNVEINVSEDIRNIRYSGILSRKQPLAGILNILRLTGELDFKIHRDRKVDAVEKKD